MSATPAHDVDMATDATNAVPTASDEVTRHEPENIVAQSNTTSATNTTITTTSGRKQPPPEKPSDARRRSTVILSFWLIVLCLGLPIWWNTTAIPRANLPLDEMMDWADGKVGNIPLFPSSGKNVQALNFALPGLSPSLSPSNFDPGKPASGTGGSKPPALDPARPRRSERLLWSPSASTAGSSS